MSNNESGGLADLSIRRPTFITAIIILMIALGLIMMKRLGVDLFPNVTFPIVTVATVYPGAGPEEIETLVSKPLEEEISTVAGIKRLSSTNQEGLSRVIAEFSLETDIKFAEQQIRDRVGSAKRKLPADIKEPVIRRIDPSDQPILILSVKAKGLSDTELFDLVDQKIKPRLEQVSQVGLVEILGGRKREIQVLLDRTKLNSREISASQVAQRLASAGENVPAGKLTRGPQETVFRTLGEFLNLKDIEATPVNLYGGDAPTTIKDLGKVKDFMEDESSRVFVNGSKSLFIYAFRQSGANTISVVDALTKRVGEINRELVATKQDAQIGVVRDSSLWIRANVTDVKESIMIGMFMAVLVVFLFLANGRSTIITGLALPNSLIGAFILMAWAGFTVNVMTLLALSLSVGLLIDDAIVVRENIFRHIEEGEDPPTAARRGTTEVRLAVIATTLTVIATFGPVGFLKGVVGQFFREFGLTICFAMTISLFDALTIAPMLSAYFAGSRKTSIFEKLLAPFNRLQMWLEVKYGKILEFTVRRPIAILVISTVVFLVSIVSVLFVPKTFLPPQDAGEFSVSLDLPPGTSLDRMSEVAIKADEIIRQNKEVLVNAITVGGRDGEANVAEMYVKLVPMKERKLGTSAVKQLVRDQLKTLAYANPVVKDFDFMGGGQRPFMLYIVGNDEAELEKISMRVFDKLKADKRLKDVDVTFRSGKPEFQIIPQKTRMQELGVSTTLLGSELRAQVEGVTPAKYRTGGYEYDVRVRLLDEQRDLKKSFSSINIPNFNGNMIRLSDVAKTADRLGPAKITRMDRGRYIGILGDITPGAGMGDVMDDVRKMFATTEVLPPGFKYTFIGQAENFQELMENMLMALGLGMLFIYLVLASLYESFVTPFTIMLALPLAMCGSFFALAVTQQSLNIFSMIGIIFLMGLASKNSILLVDLTQQLMAAGMSRSQATIQAGRTRLRPILMTTMALIAGSFPIALGLNEASRQRTSMGVAIIGGLISSTLLTLVVVPAANLFLDEFRMWSKRVFGGIFGVNQEKQSTLP